MGSEGWCDMDGQKVGLRAGRGVRRATGLIARLPVPAPRRRPRREGQVLILTLLSMSLLVGVMFYVYNVGDQVNRRLEMQGAADAAAITGGGWMARNMNVVAMNNVGMAKMIAEVPVLDAQPLASAMALAEVTQWELALAGIVSQPRIDPNVSPATEQYLRDGTESLRARMEIQRDILKPYAEAINTPNFDMEEITHWSRRGVAPGDTPHGMLWRAAVTMQEFSQAAVDSCGVLAQQRASWMARRDTATAAFIVPIRPEMPARLGQYEDFMPPIRGRETIRSEYGAMTPSGGKGGAIPDFTYPYRLGPWARLHKWRDYESEFIQTGTTWVPPTSGTTGHVIGGTRGGKGRPGGGGRTVGRSAMRGGGGRGGGGTHGSPGHMRATGYHELKGYTTYGPYEWARRRIHHWSRGHGNQSPGRLRDTFYYEYMDRISRMKLNYMFPAGAGSDTITSEIHFPNWIVPYPTCKAIGDNPANDVTRTMFYVVEIASKYPEGDAMFMSPGTFRTNGDYPITMWYNGWQDPGNWNLPQVSNYVWKDQFTYETTEDTELGIPWQMIPPGDPDGEVVWHPVYLYAWYIFGGIDTGGTHEVSNPANWESGDVLPAPILLDTSTGDYGGDDPDEGWRRQRFTYLGVARKEMHAPFWSARFRNLSSIDGTMTVAQAKVFNHRSWDLWTQDWQVQLAPVTKLLPAGDQDTWMTMMENGVSDAGVVNVDSMEVETAIKYLSSLDPEMARLFMNH